MKPKPLNIYISLPISGHDIDDVEARATFAAGVIESKGHTPINPLDFGEGGEDFTNAITSVGKDNMLLTEYTDFDELPPPVSSAFTNTLTGGGSRKSTITLATSVH